MSENLSVCAPNNRAPALFDFSNLLVFYLIDFNHSFPYTKYYLNTSNYISTRRERIEQGALVSILELKALLYGGRNFSMRIETVNSTIFRNYFGWKLYLTPKNVKISYVLEGADLPGEFNNLRSSTTSYQVGIYSTFDMEVQLRDDLDFTNFLTFGIASGVVSTSPAPSPIISALLTIVILHSCFVPRVQNCSSTAGGNWTLPVRPCNDLKYTERFDPAIPGDSSVSYAVLEVFDQRVTASLLQQQNATAVNSTGSHGYDLETFRFLGPDDSEVSAILSLLYKGREIFEAPGRYGNLSVRCLIGFRPDEYRYKSFEYDPDLSVAFNFIALPPSNAPLSATDAVLNVDGAVIGGVIGGTTATMCNHFGVCLTLL